MQRPKQRTKRVTDSKRSRSPNERPLTTIIPLFFYPFSESFDCKTKEIKIHFPGYSRTISRENYPILLSGQDLINDGAIRLCASGGLFGYWGKWKSGDGRNFTSYITHRKENVYYLSDGTQYHRHQRSQGVDRSNV